MAEGVAGGPAGGRPPWDVFPTLRRALADERRLVAALVPGVMAGMVAYAITGQEMPVALRVAWISAAVLAVWVVALAATYFRASRRGREQQASQAAVQEVAQAASEAEVRQVLEKAQQEGVLSQEQVDQAERKGRAARAERGLPKALDAGGPFLPPMPRHVRRFANRARVLLYVCGQREMLGAGGITPEDVGRWAALHEGWPDVARALMRDPTWAAALRSAASGSDAALLREVGKRANHVEGGARLHALLRSWDGMEGKAGRLAHLE